MKCFRLCRGRTVVTLGLLSIALAFTLHAQVDTGLILGVVKDPSGAVIPKAAVTLTNEGTDFTLKTTTNGTGNYQFPAIPVGSYRLIAVAPGFAREIRTHISVSIQQHLEVDFTLNPGNVSQTVTVSAAPPQLQTQNASVGAVVGRQTINNLPLNGRNYTFLAQLNAGVTQAQEDTRGLATSGTFVANGAPANQNNYLLDGIDNNSNLTDFLNGSSYAYRPSVDALQEFKVQTSNYSAQFGRAAGAVLNATIKSGTTQFHGDAWEFLRNSDLDAANFFENANSQGKGEFRLNQFGATLGGPLKIPGLYNDHRKTFFFVDYGGTRIRQAIPYVSTVPTALERSSSYTDLSELISGQSGSRTDLLGRTFPLGQVFDPATTRTVTAGQMDPVTGIVASQSGFVREPFAGNILPISRLDPNAINLLNTYPSPNVSGLFNNYASDPILKDRTDQGDLRIDENLTQNARLFVRVSHSNEPTLVPPPFDTIANGGAFNTGDETNISDNDALGWTQIISPSFINEARAGYNRINSSRVQPFASDTSIPGQFGITGLPQGTNEGGLPTYNIAGLTQLGASPWLPTHETGQTFELVDNITKVVGNHTFKGGFEFERVNITFDQPAYPRGSFNYSGTYTEVPNTSGGNTGLAQLLLTPTASSVVGGYQFVGGGNQVNASNIPSPIPAETRNYYAGYFEDDWKLTPKFTLNLGLRYSYFGHGSAPEGRQSNFLFGPPGSAQYVMTQQQCKKNLSASFLSLTAASGIGITCSDNPSLVQADTKNFAPRVGFAYHVLPKLVVRSGFGIFYGTSTNGGNLEESINYPFSYNVSFPSPDAAHPITYPNGTLATLENGLSALPLADPTVVDAHGLGFSGDQYDFHTPYSMEYNFTAQYQLSNNQAFSLAYVGTQARHLPAAVGANAVSEMLPPGLNPTNYIPFPDFARNGIGLKEAWANSNYNALQATFERRLSHGFQFTWNYTWSKCLTDARDPLNNNIGSYRAPFLPGFGIQGDYAVCGYDITQVMHMNGSYKLPFGKGKRFLRSSSRVVNAIVGNWQLNSIVTLQGGQPFTIGCPSATTAAFGCYALLVPGQDIYGGQHDVNQWMNPAAFAQPPPATSVGQADYAPLGGAPTQVRGPGFHRMDLSLFKEIPIREQMHLELRAEVFNLTNTPQFGEPGLVTVTGSGSAAPGALDFTNTNFFGKITETRDGAYDQREIQFALKLYW